MSNLRVELKQADAPDPRFEDWLLGLCAEWRICRATMEINWARDGVNRYHGALAPVSIVPDIDFTPLHRMKEIERTLGDSKPRTLFCAREIMGIAVAILAERGARGHTAALGPVLEIVRNVHAALGTLDGTLRPETPSPRPQIHRPAQPPQEPPRKLVGARSA